MHVQQEENHASYVMVPGASEVMDLAEEPTITILLNEHNPKLPSKYLSLYLQCSPHSLRKLLSEHTEIIIENNNKSQCRGWSSVTKDIYNITLVCKAQGPLWKRGWKDYKSRTTWIYCEIVSPKNSKILPTWLLITVDTLVWIEKCQEGFSLNTGN